MNKAVLQEEQVSTGRGKGGSSHKRKARPVNEEAECEDRDHWEECSACQHWVNLGKGSAELQGSCDQCGAGVRWQGHEEVQSWIQCDTCGRWRTVPDTALRQAHPDLPVFFPQHMA